jgi:NADPH:quinone reductase-like Zn-dependent oxidoreductase
VIAVTGFGGLAEKIVVQPHMAFRLPPEHSFVEGSALLMTYATAIHALVDRGRLQPKDVLVVLGAAGGVGLAAVEIGKALGAWVLGCVSSDEKAAAARAAGADGSLK